MSYTCYVVKGSYKMKEKFINSGINFISKYQECNDLKLKQLKYGLEAIYSLFFKLSIAIIISAITNTFKETLLFLLFYSFIRTCSYGMHAKSNISCWIMTITIYNIIPLIIKHYTFPNYIGFITLGIGLISAILWAPADTPKKPLIRKKQRLICKIISIIIIILYGIIFTFNTNNLINNAIIYAIIIQSIFINPITYKITNTQFNNYKYYHKKITTV